MIRVFSQSLRAVLVLTVLTGVVYPAAVTGVARLLFEERSLGSPVREPSGQLTGSLLIGQSFTRPEYFWGRPSASHYDATASGGTNRSPVGADAIARIASERARLRAANPDAVGEPPLLLLTCSGSGLDPHISPEAALWQVPRVAKARHVEPSRIVSLIVEPRIQGRTLGVLGEPRVDVLELNRELERLFPVSR